jgi:hypothetical protein
MFCENWLEVSRKRSEPTRRAKARLLVFTHPAKSTEALNLALGSDEFRS